MKHNNIYKFKFVKSVMTTKKRELQLEKMMGDISKTVRECRGTYDNPKISRVFKRAYSYTLIGRTKDVLTDLSNRVGDYLLDSVENGIKHIRTTYKLMLMDIR